MKKVKSLLYTFIHSLIPSSSYYSKILHMHFVDSMKYFLILLAIMNILFIASIIAKYNYAKVNANISTVISSLKRFPADLSVQIVNGRLLSNYDRPYFHWITVNQNQKLFAVIDESATPQKIQQYNSLILLTGNNIVVKSKNDLQISTLKNLGNFRIDWMTANRIIEKLVSVQQYLPIIYIGIILILLILLPISSSILMFGYLLVSSTIGYLGYKYYSKHHIKFKKAVQIALHASTLPLLIDYTIIIVKPSCPYFSQLSLPQNYFPFVFIGLLSLFIFAGIYEAHYHQKHT